MNKNYSGNVSDIIINININININTRVMHLNWLYGYVGTPLYCHGVGSECYDYLNILYGVNFEVDQCHVTVYNVGITVKIERNEIHADVSVRCTGSAFQSTPGEQPFIVSHQPFTTGKQLFTVSEQPFAYGKQPFTEVNNRSEHINNRLPSVNCSTMSVWLALRCALTYLIRPCSSFARVVYSCHNSLLSASYRILQV